MEGEKSYLFSPLMAVLHTLRYWLSNHDIQDNVLFRTFQVNLLHDLESKFPIDDWIDVVGALQITSSTFSVRLWNSVSSIPSLYTSLLPTYLFRDMLNQLSGVSSSPALRFCPNVH